MSTVSRTQPLAIVVLCIVYPKAQLKFFPQDVREAQPYISAPNAHAECAFRVFCDNFDAIGFWGSVPIIYPCLRPLCRLPDVTVLKETGWTKRQNDAVVALTARTEDMLAATAGLCRLACAGSRVSHQQRDELAAGWADFAQRERCCFPLRASVAVPHRSPARIARPAC